MTGGRRLRGTVREAAASLRRLGTSNTVRTLRRVLTLAVVALIGAALGLAVAPSTAVRAGPLDLDVRTVLGGQAPLTLDLPPVGTVTFPTHDGPMDVEVSVTSIDLAAATRFIESPEEAARLSRTMETDLKDAVTRAAATSIGCAGLGAVVAVALVYRRPRPAVAGLAFALVPALVIVSVAAATFSPAQLSQPTFTGLLTRAPYVIGQTQATADRLESYRTGIEGLTRSVSSVYAAANRLPVLPQQSSDVTTVLHVSDIHLNPQSFDVISTLVEQFRVAAVLDTGDLTTLGSDLESGFAAPIGQLKVPYVYIRGNHDSKQTEEAVRRYRNAVVLDDQVRTVAGLKIAGIGDYTFTPAGDVGSRAKAEEAAQELARTITAANREGDPVDLAMIHNPTGIKPLSGTVPLVLAGHMHTRATRLDEDGTRLMVQGSTGGEGFTQGTFNRLGSGDEPVPLSATLLYFAELPGQVGKQLVAYDEVTVGGLGLAAVSVQRTVIDTAEPKPDDSPLPDVTPVVAPPPGASPSATATGSGSPSPTTQPQSRSSSSPSTVG